MKKVLVTGGTGFLGARLVSKLIEEGHHVTFTGRNLAKAKPLIDKGAVFSHHSFTENSGLSNLKKLTDGVDTVFHCAAKSSPWGTKVDHMNTNWLGTKSVVEACLNSSVRRLVHVSTASVYFNFSDCLALKETDPLPQVAANQYSASKCLAEKEVMSGFAAGLDTVILRPRGIFGPGDEAIVPRLVRANGKIGIPLVRGGQAVSDITFVDNVVDSMLLAMGAPPAVAGKTYNITNGQPMKIIDLLKLLFQALALPLKLRPLPYSLALNLASGMEGIAALTNREPFFTRYTLSLLSFSQTLDLGASKGDLNYRPQTSIEEGFKKCAESMRAEKK
jgi:nucleoside-diphosphate-sugar epimerase